MKKSDLKNLKMATFLKFNEEASQVRFLNYFIWTKYKSV